MDIAKLMEAKRAWAIWNLLNDLQERLWDRYEDEFLEFAARRYNPDYNKKPMERS